MRPPEVFVRELTHEEAMRLKRLAKSAKHQLTRPRAGILLTSRMRHSAPQILTLGALFGALFGLLAYAIDSDEGDGERRFMSDRSIVGDRYEVQADEGVADEAKRVLAAMPGRL